MAIKTAIIQTNYDKGYGCLKFTGIRRFPLFLKIQDLIIILGTVLQDGYSMEHPILKSYSYSSEKTTSFSETNTANNTIHFKNLSGYAGRFYPYLGELISVVKACLGVFQFNEKFSKFCKNSFPQEYQEFSEYFPSEKPSSSTNPEMANPQTVEETQPVSVVETTPMEIEPKTDKKDEYRTVSLKIPTEFGGLPHFNMLYGSFDHFMEAMKNENKDQLTKLYDELKKKDRRCQFYERLDATSSTSTSMSNNVSTSTSGTTSGPPMKDLKSMTDEEKKDYLKKMLRSYPGKNHQVILKGQKESAALIKLNKETCKVLLTDNRSCNCSYSLVYEYSGVSGNNILDTIKTKIEVGKCYRTTNGECIRILEIYQINVLCDIKNKGKHRIPLSSLRDVEELKNEDMSQYGSSSYQSNYSNDESDEEDETDNYSDSGLFEPCCENFVKNGVCGGCPGWGSSYY